MNENTLAENKPNYTRSDIECIYPRIHICTILNCAISPEPSLFSKELCKHSRRRVSGLVCDFERWKLKDSLALFLRDATQVTLYSNSKKGQWDHQRSKHLHFQSDRYLQCSVTVCHKFFVCQGKALITHAEMRADLTLPWMHRPSRRLWRAQASIVYWLILFIQHEKKMSFYRRSQQFLHNLPRREIFYR